MPSHASICGWYSSTCSLAASKLRGQARVAAVGVCGVAASPASGASASQAAISALVCFIRNDMGFSGRTLAGTMLHNRRPTRESRLARQWEQSDLKTFRIRQKKDRSAGCRAACGQCLHKPGLGRAVARSSRNAPLRRAPALRACILLCPVCGRPCP
ncbi:exported protein of unknown function [Cupriavidus taiwanensis]|uniref:Uncharacterized protein n=1 Tax=Cupriavidus taiwanensis TaxID=164546 RepID=A0A375I7W5_9BURK|nr:exported protein of unknown function [Cupriavidus taiwanensis]